MPPNCNQNFAEKLKFVYAHLETFIMEIQKGNTSTVFVNPSLLNHSQLKVDTIWKEAIGTPIISEKEQTQLEFGEEPTQIDSDLAYANA